MEVPSNSCCWEYVAFCPFVDFIAQYQRFFHGVAVQAFDDDRFCHADGFLAAIGVFGDALAANLQSQILHHLRRNHAPDGIGVDHGFHLAPAHLVARQLPSPGQRFVLTDLVLVGERLA